MNIQLHKLFFAKEIMNVLTKENYNWILIPAQKKDLICNHRNVYKLILEMKQQNKLNVVICLYQSYSYLYYSSSNDW